MSVASSSSLAVAVCNTATPIPPEVAQYIYPPLLGKEKPSTPGFSYPVWLQGELRNSGESETTIVATATWTDEGNVTRTCTFTRTDLTTPADLDGDPVGTRWGALFHEKSYVIPVFRAGDGTP
jgi:hypothetical protein